MVITLFLERKSPTVKRTYYKILYGKEKYYNQKVVNTESFKKVSTVEILGVIMLPYSEPLAHEMMARGATLVGVKNPRHAIIPFPCVAYDVFVDDHGNEETIGVLTVRYYFHGDAKDADGTRVEPSPLRIKDVEYLGEVPGYGHVKLTAAEFPEWLYLSNRFPNKNARENFTPDTPLFRLDHEPIKFVAYEVDGKERAERVAQLAEHERQKQTPPETHADSAPA